MGTPIVNGCCCGCSLEKGTIIIGCVEMFTSIFYLVMSAIIVGKTYIYMDYVSAIWITQIVRSSIDIQSIVLMLWGTAKGKPQYIFMWLLCAIVDVVVQISSPVLYFTIRGLADEVVVMIIINLVLIVLKCYFFAVVYSLYKNMAEKPVKTVQYEKY